MLWAVTVSIVENAYLLGVFSTYALALKAIRRRWQIAEVRGSESEGAVSARITRMLHGGGRDHYESVEIDRVVVDVDVGR